MWALPIIFIFACKASSLPAHSHPELYTAILSTASYLHRQGHGKLEMNQTFFFNKSRQKIASYRPPKSRPICSNYEKLSEVKWQDFVILQCRRFPVSAFGRLHQTQINAIDNTSLHQDLALALSVWLNQTFIIPAQSTIKSYRRRIIIFSSKVWGSDTFQFYFFI